MLKIEFTEKGLRLTSDDHEAENAAVADALNESDDPDDGGYGEAYEIWNNAPFEDGQLVVEFEQPPLVIDVCQRLLEFEDDGGRISNQMETALQSAPENVREALL